MTQENIDHAEIQKFNSLSGAWWEEDGHFKTLHQLNPLRLQFIKAHTNLLDKKIIDVGCGGGILSEGLAKEGAVVTGIDVAEDAINAAKNHLGISQLVIDYQLTTVEDFTKSYHEAFDNIVCMEMLEHVPDPSSVIKACSQLVVPGGQLFFSTINRNPKAYLYAIVGAEWLLRLLPKGTHDYAKFIRPAELAAWCRQCNLRVKAISGISYQPFTKTFSLTEDISVNYLLCCEKNA